MNKIEVLQQALQARIDEVEHYQINIDNYKSALVLMENLQDEELFEFATQIKELLQTSIIEQKKANIMLKVIKQQLGD